MNYFLAFLFVFAFLLDLSKMGSSKHEKTIDKKIKNIAVKDTAKILVGASRLELYLPDIKGKRVGLVVNHTALVGTKHLVDTLQSLKIDIKKIFVPEHGFRGDADAGETVGNTVDKKTGIPIVSIYGTQKKPSPEQMADLDVLIFDIQDVGARFYTFISTMHYVMEACAENNKQIIVLDRPNPNGNYVDGPVLDMKLKSFVGMHPIPIVHGLTIGELAMMINAEKWLSNANQCNLKVIPVENYNHQYEYSLPVKPSPNLPNDLSIRLYPALCLFEGTAISIGRGTYFPFQVIGYPDSRMGDFSFIPESINGMSKTPKYQGQKCYGIDFREGQKMQGFDLKYLIEFYSIFPDKNTFFNGYFDTLVGNYELQNQIKAGLSEVEIRKTWEKDLETYRILRKKYLLYSE